MDSKKLPLRVVILIIITILLFIGIFVLSIFDTHTLGGVIDAAFIEAVRRQAIIKAFRDICIFLAFLGIAEIMTEIKSMDGKSKPATPLILIMLLIVLFMTFGEKRNNPMTYISGEPQIRIETCTDTHCRTRRRGRTYFADFGTHTAKITSKKYDSTVIGNNYYTIYFGDTLYDYYDPDLYMLSPEINID